MYEPNAIDNEIYLQQISKDFNWNTAMLTQERRSKRAAFVGEHDEVLEFRMTHNKDLHKFMAFCVQVNEGIHHTDRTILFGGPSNPAWIEQFM